MTVVALIGRPGDIPVMARSAKPPFNDVGHFEIVAADTHLESKLGVTDFAAETDAVKPVWENDRPHTFFFRPPVENHVAIFGGGRRNDPHQGHDQQEKRPDCCATAHLGGTAPAGIAIGSDGLIGLSPGLETLWQRKHSVSGNETAP